MEGFEEFDSCSICMEAFDAVLRPPKLLPCQHTFCKGCLCDMVMKGDETAVPCPECRNVQPLPPGGWGELPNNLTMLRYIEQKDQLRAAREQAEYRRQLRAMVGVVEECLKHWARELAAARLGCHNLELSATKAKDEIRTASRRLREAVEQREEALVRDVEVTVRETVYRRTGGLEKHLESAALFCKRTNDLANGKDRVSEDIVRKTEQEQLRLLDPGLEVETGQHTPEIRAVMVDIEGLEHRLLTFGEVCLVGGSGVITNTTDTVADVTEPNRLCSTCSTDNHLLHSPEHTTEAGAVSLNPFAESFRETCAERHNDSTEDAFASAEEDFSTEMTTSLSLSTPVTSPMSEEAPISCSSGAATEEDTITPPEDTGEEPRIEEHCLQPDVSESEPGNGNTVVSEIATDQNQGLELVSDSEDIIEGATAAIAAEAATDPSEQASLNNNNPFQRKPRGPTHIDFASKTSPVHIIGRPGKRPGEFSNPCGVCLIDEDHLLVADTHNKRLQAMTLGGSLLNCFGEPKQSSGLRSFIELPYNPEALCRAPGDCVAVLLWDPSSNNKSIRILSRDGAVVREIPGMATERMIRVTLDQEGRIYGVLKSHHSIFIKVLDSQGNFLRKLDLDFSTSPELLSIPQLRDETVRGLALLDDEPAVVALQNYIILCDPDGCVQNVINMRKVRVRKPPAWPPGPGLRGVWTCCQGNNILVTDDVDQAMFVFDKDGNIVHKIKAGLKRPWGVCVGLTDPTVIVTDTELHKVFIF